MVKRREDRLNGPLYDPAGNRGVQFIPYVPSEDLKFFVEQYWIIHWDLRDQPPYETEHVPDPSVHLIVENEISGIFGPARGRFSRLVEDAGFAFCIKFKPGAFYPFVLTPVSGLRNKTAAIGDVFGTAGHILEMAVRAAGDEEERIELAEDFLRGLHPEWDDTLALIHKITERIVAGREVMRTYDLESEFNVPERTLQRMFNRYVGVSPSWVIRRYRIHDAIDRLDHGGIVDWPALAVDLGYFDQAHFIKDFKRIVGRSPGKYVEQVSQAANS